MPNVAHFCGMKNNNTLKSENSNSKNVVAILFIILLIALYMCSVYLGYPNVRIVTGAIAVITSLLFGEGLLLFLLTKTIVISSKLYSFIKR